MTVGIRCVVFDFDGVLIDSNRMKHEAYYYIFRDAGVPSELIAACLADHADGDRREVIHAIVSRGHNMESPPEYVVTRFVDAYARRCDSQIAKCGDQPGATMALTTLAARYPLYVNSATPVESLERYIADRGWSQYFRRVLGRPNTKIENFAIIRTLERIDGRSILFVGDHQSDAVAAEAAQCAFVGIRSDDSNFTEPCDILEHLDRLPDFARRLEVPGC